MPFNIRSTAVIASTIVFFFVAAVGVLCKNCPFTCCKRAGLAMLITYLAVSCIVRLVNAIVVDAMITKQVNERLNKDRS